MALRFRPNWRNALLAALFLPVTISACFWQLDRAGYKQGLEGAYQQAQSMPALGCAEARKLGAAGAWRRAVAEGQFLSSRQILVDNRTHEGRAGYAVVTPMRCEGELILVDRGWLPLPDQRRNVAPDIDVDRSRKTVFGTWIVRRSESSGIAESPFGEVWPVRIGDWNWPLIEDALSDEGSLGELWFVLEDGQSGALTTQFPERDFKISMHQGYAFQWFAISVGIVAWFLFTAFRR